MPQYITCDPDVVTVNGKSAVSYDFKASGVESTTLTVYKHVPPDEDIVEHIFITDGDDPVKVQAPPGCTGITIEDAGPGASDAAAIAVDK